MMSVSISILSDKFDIIRIRSESEKENNYLYLYPLLSDHIRFMHIPSYMQLSQILAKLLNKLWWLFAS